MLMNLIKKAHIIGLVWSFMLIAILLPAQDGAIVSKAQILLENQEIWSDISADKKLLDEYAYLDSLVFYEIEYLSDSDTVLGYFIEPKFVEKKIPVVIFNRGGNRDFGSLNLFTLISYTSKLASAGYIILASNYREQDEFGGAEINDVLNLIKTSALIENADTSNIGMFGWSRGGMMCYLAMAKSDKIKSVIVGNGPSNLFKTLEERPGLEKSVFSQCIPNYWGNREDALRSRSVMYWTEKLNPNTNLLMLAGTEDMRVSHTQSVDLSEKLKSTNPNFELKLYETDHFFSDHKHDLNQEVINWFNHDLKGVK